MCILVADEVKSAVWGRGYAWGRSDITAERADAR